MGITLVYQTRPFLDDSQFSLIAIPAYAILPGILTLYASVIAIKLHKQKNYESKGYAMFAIAAAFWFVAEQIWQLYDHVWEGESFPSEADIFYMASYPLIAAFLFLSLKPVIRKVPRNVWLFAIGLAFSLLIPSVLAAYDDMFEEDTFPTIVALTYPILSAIILVPAIIGILFLAKQGANLSWMLILFGFIIYGVADIFFLFAELDGAYYDGHPVDLLYLYTYILIIFAFHVRLKIANLPVTENRTIFFTEHIKFETISKFGIPLTVAIVCMIILISISHSIFMETDNQTSTQNIMMGVVAMLAVFALIVITINKNLARLVKMRTNELIEQRDNLENLIEEKTHEILKSERLSAIGELERMGFGTRQTIYRYLDSAIQLGVDGLTKDSKTKQYDRVEFTPTEKFETFCNIHPITQDPLVEDWIKHDLANGGFSGTGFVASKTHIKNLEKFCNFNKVTPIQIIQDKGITGKYLQNYLDALRDGTIERRQLRTNSSPEIAFQPTRQSVRSFIQFHGYRIKER